MPSAVKVSTSTVCVGKAGESIEPPEFAFTKDVLFICGGRCCSISPYVTLASVPNIKPVSVVAM